MTVEVEKPHSLLCAVEAGEPGEFAVCFRPGVRTRVRGLLVKALAVQELGALMSEGRRGTPLLETIRPDSAFCFFSVPS